MDKKAVMEDLSKQLKRFSKLIGEFCPGETPDLGSMILLLEELSVSARQTDSDTFYQVVESCRHFVENMTLETMSRTKPLEDARLLLEALFRHMKKGIEFTFETRDVIDILDSSILTKAVPEDEPEVTEPAEPAPREESPEAPEDPDQEPEPISGEDLEILMDFVSEAEENLDSIEVHLIELEQDPEDSDIINNIFRPVHTIKGVAGFLSLKKINQLAHTTENLLDSARSGEFMINDLATDAILESVDTLKQLIKRVKQGVAQGVKLPDHDIDINGLRDRLQNLHIQLTKGTKEPLGEILVKQGVIDEKSLEETLETQKVKPNKKIGEILVEEKKAEPVQVAQALMEQKTEKKRVATQVKVNTEKLDDLVDYAGELVIAQSMLKQKVSDDPSLIQSVTQLGQIVSNMQHIAMSMRMISIKATFMKMIRLVRDLSKKSGKPVNLTMAGEETEIDRNVVDALYEPMVHMIRNSVDHGIEPVDQRRDTGKPDQGTVHLSAYHKGGNIIIEIQDDGKGLDKDRIMEKGVQSGLVSENDQLTDPQIYDLILQPGFSTAKEITDVSGRGVGMDVVKSGIERFRGHLKIESQKGIGTKFTISLPLTLAIIDGMLVRVGKEKYVIPTTAIQRAFKPEKENCFTVEGKGELIKERERLIPIVRLRGLYSGEEDTKNVWDCLAVVVESKDEQKALVIDELLGKDEYVIKSLGGNLEGIQGFSGGAILADGRVGLILDIHGIFQLAESN
ncbi:MAG: chemotaxis protein CheW [Desulfobacterales bacterium]|nr:chemotaxis protein CheW [Desulfobacterales bacterium]